VVFGSVIIQSADNTARSDVINVDGTFAIEDVHRGTARIAVLSPDPRKSRPINFGGKPIRQGQDAEGDVILKNWVALPRQYENPETSGITCTVDAAQVTYDIDLK
jgi:hypothetical protein